MRCLVSLPCCPLSLTSLKTASECAQAYFTSGLTGYFLEQLLRPHVEQISPDKNVNFPCAIPAFTISPESGALLRCANLPGDLALYAVPVRGLTGLRSSFLQTSPHDYALAFG